MGPAGLFCVRLSQFLMSGSRGHPDDQYRNEKRTRSVTRTVHRPLAHDLVLEVSYPRGPTRRRQGAAAWGDRAERVETAAAGRHRGYRGLGRSPTTWSSTNI